MAEHDVEQIEQRNKRERQKRNIALALSLAGLVLLFFVMTLVRLGNH